MTTEEIVQDDHDSADLRKYASSSATRLLCAGAYLDPRYRRAVVRELMKNWWRMVVPAYGYDTVSVLAHSLAAMRLRRSQMQIMAVGTVVIFILMSAQILVGPVGPLLFLWLAWAAAFLRRIATLNILITQLRPAEPGQPGPDGGYPEDRLLTPRLVEKISFEQSSGLQASGQHIVYYGGYDPFVGAGNKVRDWSNATLLVEAPPDKFTEGVTKITAASGNGAAPTKPARKAIKPFSANDLMDYAAERLYGDLRQAPDAERIELLTVERCNYGKATGLRPEGLDKTGLEERDISKIRWEEDYGTIRDYLCIRIGSWDQELVTSLFVGFDVKGNTLHSEFYGYALLPIKADFHLVDRLPPAMTTGLAVRVAWDVAKSAPATLFAIVRGLATGSLSEGGIPRRRKRGKARVLVTVPTDRSQFRLGRYARKILDRGALLSIREMAMSEDYHHFFQESDADKYWQIVERRILRIVEDFLDDHNVDPTDHRRAQTNILNHQDFGQNNNFGNNNNFNQGDNANQATGDGAIGGN